MMRTSGRSTSVGRYPKGVYKELMALEFERLRIAYQNMGLE